MRHSWLELEDGTARCRRCPALRRPTTKKVAEYVEVTLSDLGEVFVDVEEEPQGAVEVSGAHPSKCGKPVRR